MAKNLKKITELPSASTPLSGSELFEMVQKDINGAWKNRKVSLRKLVNPFQDEHNELKNLQGGNSTLNEYYHLDLNYYNKIINDEYTLRTETQAVSASALQQAKDYTDIEVADLRTETQDASATLYSEILALSASYDEHNELKNKQGGAPNEYYHLDFEHYSRVDNDEYTLRTETQAASANALQQAKDYTDALRTETQAASANALQQANDYTDTQTQAASANALQQANDYTDTQITNTETLISSVSAETLSQSKSYTDTLIAAVSAAIGFETYSGVVSLSNGISAANILYDIPQVDSVYSITTELINEVDSPPSIYSKIITNKTKNGFSVLLSGLLDSSNYKLDFILSRNQSASSSSTSSSSSSESSSSSSTSASSSSSSHSATWASYHSYIPLGGTHWYIRQNLASYGEWNVAFSGYRNATNWHQIRLENRQPNPTVGNPGWWTGFRPTKVRLTWVWSGAGLQALTLANLYIDDAFGNLYTHGATFTSGQIIDISSIVWNVSPNLDDIWRFGWDYNNPNEAFNNYVTNIEFYA